MDWKKTFNRAQWVIHGIFVVSIIIGIGSTLYALRLNTLQSTEEERGLKINNHVQYLKNDRSFEKIGKYLSWAESDKANDKMRELAQKLAETEELLEFKASEDLSLGMRTFNKLINNTSGMSNPADALKVLIQKVSTLQDVAKSNGFKNITIVADRMKDRLGQLNPKNVGGSVQVSYLKSDLTRLMQLVEKSTLTDGEKAGLKNRFDSMMGEIELLGSLNSQSRDLRAHENQASLALSQWMIEVEKRAENLQGIRLQKQNQLIIMLAGMVGFLVIAWMGLAYMFRWQRERISTQVEGEVKNVIEKGIIADQRFMMDHYSENTREEIVKLLDNLKIKLNLGSMLHEGLPFAGCMIDNSFKLTWFNHLFLEQLYLSEEEVRSDAFNWDYVRDYLNLDQDPIYQALVNKIAGIYPVKVKQDEMTPAQPYEMYVTPITVNREDRVMVFFYPLVSVKEAIDEQVELIRQTVNRFVSLWNDEKMNEDEMRLLEKDFKNNDLSDVYQNLVSIYSKATIEKNEYVHVIHTLEKENEGYAEMLFEMGQLEEKKKGLIKEEFKLANELRDSFLQSVERSESLIHINKTVMQQNDDFKNEAMKVQSHSNEVLKKNKETVEILGQLDGIKTDYKKLKFELLEVKTKLISFTNNLFANLPPLDEQQQKLANRYKDELARLDFNVVTLDKKLSQLDVFLAKLSMMHEKNPIEQTMFNFQTSQKDHELREALLTIQRGLSLEEGKIVESFKSLHALMKQDLKTVTDSFDITTSSPENFLS